MSREIIIAPSILAADAARLNEEIEKVKDAKWLHLDIMDGHFVPNLSFSAHIVAALRKCSNLFFDTHLMITDPEKYIDDFLKAGSDNITVHYESILDNERLIKIAEYLHNKGVKAGISIKPKTPVEVLKPILDKFDMLLIMTVEPGFGGQSYMADMEPKIKWARENYPELDIQVDGGIGDKTIKGAAEAGANIFVAGSSVFGAEDKANAIQNLKKIAEENLR